MSHNHKEAFHLMIYRDEETGEEEVLWNSRDGVTPFIITSKNGNSAQHVNWHLDVYKPNFKPVKGLRIFIDATEELIKPKVIEFVDKYWDKGMDRGFVSKEEAVESYIKDWLKPGAPMVVVSDGKGGYTVGDQ